MDTTKDNPETEQSGAGNAGPALPMSREEIIRETFAQEYLHDFNATRAYGVATGRDAYPSMRIDAWRYIRRQEVAARIQELTDAKLASLDVTTDKLIGEVARIAFFDPMQFMKINERGQPEIDMQKVLNDPEARACLDIEFSINVTKDGDRVPVYKVRAHNKLDALEKLVKMKKLYAPSGDPAEQKRPIHVHVNIPIPGGGWRNNDKQQPIDADFSETDD